MLRDDDGSIGVGPGVIHDSRRVVTRDAAVRFAGSGIAPLSPHRYDVRLIPDAADLAKRNE